ncbi:MAG: domain containing protein [Solirubrobacterales bacterium]|nr:domain containing protein [Solirubrobacterales bacterium]
MNEPTRIDPAGPTGRWRPSRLTVALSGASGFLAGVLLVAALGGTPTITQTETRRVTVTAAPATATSGTVITITAVPRLVGERLDTARERLEAARFQADITRGGGLFGPLDDGNWVVVAQDPVAGTQLQQGSSVRIQIERS